MCSHMWSMEEELIDPAAHGLMLLKEPQSQAFGTQRLAAALAALCLFSAFGTTMATKGGSPRKWHLDAPGEHTDRSAAMYSV